MSTEPFNLPNPGSAEALSILETPSGEPFHCVPQDPPQTVTGSFAVFNYPVKSAEADPAVVSFMLGFRDAGEDFGGSLTCGYVGFMYVWCLLFNVELCLCYRLQTGALLLPFNSVHTCDIRMTVEMFRLYSVLFEGLLPCFQLSAFNFVSEVSAGRSGGRRRGLQRRF